MKNCTVAGCPNEAGPRTETCANCRSARYYWGLKRPAQIVERRRKLTLYGERLDTFFLDRKGKK